ncbi:hypothetical protein C8R43DRAFT_978578 [Mycena crocata]|nr:hypothetical protein C8R43DRAFT_978578 [Mycena crocata]
MHVVNVTILLYDYSLTVDLETSLMWSSKWSLTKVLFFLSRYSPVFDVPVLLYYSLVSDLSFERCSQLHEGASWATIFGIGVAEAILVLRTYALSGRKRSVLVFFGALWMAGILASIALLKIFLQTVTYGPPPIPGIPGCYLTDGNVVFVTVSFILVLLNDTIIMAYTLWLGAGTYRRCRNPLVVTLFRDGIVYYVFLAVISAINVATLLQAPMPIAQLCNTFLRVVHSVLSTRILLHVRDIERLESERSLSQHPVVNLSFASDSDDGI